MRSRQEIEVDAGKEVNTMTTPFASGTASAIGALIMLQLEVLLDIRDLIQKASVKPAVKHPESPPPPAVNS